MFASPESTFAMVKKDGAANLKLDALWRSFIRSGVVKGFAV
jgi:hypothetical protein